MSGIASRRNRYTSNIMNGASFGSRTKLSDAAPNDDDLTAEQIVFDKAEAAAAREALTDERTRLAGEIAELEADEERHDEARQADLATRRARLAEVETSLAADA